MGAKNGSDDNISESIENAKKSGNTGRVGTNPKAYNKQKSSFYNATDYNEKYKEQLQRQNLIKSDKELRFAIIGTGPAGFYMAKNLLKNVDKCRIDLIDRNPHPFGLIRTGVAPDHQAMKKIENDFSQVLADEKTEFFGNVWVGEEDEARARGCYHLTMKQLREKYSAVILANGAISDRDLGIPGEHELRGVLPARRVVDWYNGSLDLDLAKDEFDVSEL